MLTDSEFRDLMARTRAGDEEAARECVRLYEPEIRRAARMRLNDQRLRRIMDSMDISQSVFGRFFRVATEGSLELETPVQMLALLVTMTRNRVIDLHRRETAQRRNGKPFAGARPPADVAEIAADGAGPGTAAAARELLSKVRSELCEDELEIADRRNAGESWKEIAAALGKPEDQLRKKLARALERVRLALDCDADASSLE